MYKFFLVCCVAGLFLQGGAAAQDSRKEAHIGVLAYRGSEQIQLRWLALSEYLNATIPDWSFHIVPMTLSSAQTQINTGQLDYIATNPGHFVTLNRANRMSVLASRAQQKSDGTFAGQFGSTIIARKGTGIEGLQDISMRSVSAVDLSAFGGFQVAWYEIDRAGVDIFAEDVQLKFIGFPMDEIVLQVARGEADIGIVRSGLIEEMALEGRIDPDSFTYLNANVTYSHPDRISTGLYPEWPFAALASADPALNDRVTLALLMAQGSDLAQVHGMVDMWTAPVPYHSAAELTDAFQARLALLNEKRDRPTRFVVIPLLVLVLAACVLYWRRRIAPPARTPNAVIAGDKSSAAGLTPREREILDLVARGNSTKEIAIQLGISPKTVEFHRANLLRKFGARTSSQLVALAT
ncbi:PhnD/SsuA/transferrin family substrate-binding protein [uncultured Sulfitobacter sp.]|uniref:PhnD/SsuA/transferrin family substrate-binding protein n=1 Tax=uncultured Sulfitobacter sp. TaxID=191468 RepID=UPI00261365B1|nr:PhnD/SsuA/transferrin family substrate-binding protein [uncultured Sulfitobacter sp.]